jgi:hypothetical protein
MNMFHKTMIGAAMIAVAAGAVALAKVLRNEKDKDASEEGDDTEVHFIKIDDDDEEKENEDAAKFDASGKSEEVQEVCGVYPYLNPDFVEEMLAKNSEFDAMFENDTLIQITHRVTFKEHTDLETFLDIMDEAGYICVQLSKDEMTAQKKLFTEEGAILSDVLNVANQTAALHGCYEGQTVSK